MESLVTPETVLQLKGPTEAFLCNDEANSCGIRFLSFRVRDADGGQVLFEQGKPDSLVGPEGCETAKHDFGPDFLNLKTIGASLRFLVPNKSLRGLRMIERHYFQDTLLQSFDFSLPFCMPDSVNEWEFVYSMPELDERLRGEITASPYETISDTFYFVENSLIIHKKAMYNFSAFEYSDDEGENECDQQLSEATNKTTNSKESIVPH